MSVFGYRYLFCVGVVVVVVGACDSRLMFVVGVMCAFVGCNMLLLLIWFCVVLAVVATCW